MLQHLFLEAADHVSDTGLLPLFAELRNYLSEKGDLVSFLVETAHEFDRSFSRDKMEDLLERGQVEILLDGLDERGEIKPDAEELVMNDLRAHFRPEFLNRLDEIIMFKPLTKANIGMIVDLMVKELDKRLADQELSLELTEAAKDNVIENGYDPVYGARPLKRYLQKYVETLAARKILSGDVHAGDTLVLDMRDGEFTVRIKE